jgi:predicted dehydrogenase
LKAEGEITLTKESYGRNALRVVLVGSGFIASQKHLPAWKRLKNAVQVTAICDLDRRRSEEVARQFGVPKVYEDLAAMLEREQPDVVDICTPPRTHAPLALQALKAGSHVLIEKPMAMNVQECDEIIAAAQRAKRQVCVAHSDLFYPAFLELRRLVQQGTIGEFRGMRLLLSTPVSYMTAQPDHWAHKLPGGVVGETGPHAVYLTLAFINPIKEVKVHAHKVLHQYPWSAFEDYRIDLIGEHAISSVALIYTTNQWAAEIEIWGSEGFLYADLESQSLALYQRATLKPYAVGWSAFAKGVQIIWATAKMAVRFLTCRAERTHDLLIRQFVESLQKETPPPVSPEEGREAVRVMHLIAEQVNLIAGQVKTTEGR